MVAPSKTCYETWLAAVRKAEKTCIIQDGKRKVHYKFENGSEMVEEYSLETNVVLRRAWKVNKRFGNVPKWEIEIGDPDPGFPMDSDNVGIKESSTSPMMTVRTTKQNLEWRIRNLPYPVDTYTVTANTDKPALTVRTNNKKFFKIIPIPDLERINMKAEQDKISITHKFNTLIITYKKPGELIVFEKLAFEEISKLKARREGDVQCPQS